MRVVIIGGGPAGMMAAGQAAKAGASTILLERNNRLGKKLAITGKGRGNLTNTADLKDFVAEYPDNGRFLYGPLSRFDNNDLRSFFHELGVPTVVERGGRVFPQSQDASDLVAAMKSFLHKTGVTIHKDSRVTSIITENGKVCNVVSNERKYPADAVVLATGGASYPATGSTGDGYRLSSALGHKITTPRPALVPLETKEKWVHDITGLSLRNVYVSLTHDGREFAGEFGEMLFTHFGVSGPVILTISRVASDMLASGKKLLLHINLKPALSAEQLDARILRDFEKLSRRQFKNSLSELLPAALIKHVIDISGIDPDQPVHQVNRQQRRRLQEVLQDLTITITGTRPLSEAIVTAGGVLTSEINPTTMASRIVRGLYFAGELIDVAGNTGGYNLQAAFSTGYLAGISAACQE